MPNATEIIPRAINATFNGAATAAAWVPTVEIISDAGVVIARCPCATTVIAGGSAECSFYPFSDEVTSTTAQSFADTVASVGGGTLRGFWRLGESAAPLADTSGWTGGPTDLALAGAGAAPTFHVPGALGGGQDDGAIVINGGVGTGQYLHNASGAINTGINGAFSIMAWVKPSSSAASIRGGIYNNTAPHAGLMEGWTLAGNWAAGAVDLRLTRTIAGVRAVALVNVSFDVWTFLVGTYDGANLRLYTNGLLQATTADARADTFNPYSNTDLAVSFYDPVAPADRFLGTIDEVAIWGAVLTIAEIQELYAASF